MSGPDETTGDGPSSSRAVQLALCGVIAVAIVGFVVGTVGEPRGGAGLEGAAASPAPRGDVLPAGLGYRDMARTRLGPNAGFETNLDRFAPPPRELLDASRPDPRLKLASLEARATRRAYNGAPPVIPHAVDQLSSESCLVCHADGLAAGGVGAAVMPHGTLLACTQCHVESRSPLFEPFVLAASTFAGRPAPFEGPRAAPGAPPLLPHSTLMRENCLSCHGPQGPAGMRTTHPERRSCLQCHAPSAELDQAPPGAGASMLAPLRTIPGRDE